MRLIFMHCHCNNNVSVFISLMWGRQNKVYFLPWFVCLFVFFRGDVMGNSASTEDARPLKGPEARFFGKF